MKVYAVLCNNNIKILSFVVLPALLIIFRQGHIVQFSLFHIFVLQKQQSYIFTIKIIS